LTECGRIPRIPPPCNAQLVDRAHFRPAGGSVLLRTAVPRPPIDPTQHH
jgi:hypothetical protein